MSDEEKESCKNGTPLLTRYIKTMDDVKSFHKWLKYNDGRWLNKSDRIYIVNNIISSYELIVEMYPIINKEYSLNRIEYSIQQMYQYIDVKLTKKKRK